MISVKEKIENVVLATESLNISKQEEINNFLDELNVGRHFLVDLNRGIEHLIATLEQLTWIKSCSKEDMLSIRIVLSTAHSLIPVLNWNNLMFCDKLGKNLPLLTETNKRLIEDFKEVLIDVKYSLFEHKNTEEMNDLYQRLKNI